MLIHLLCLFELPNTLLPSEKRTFALHALKVCSCSLFLDVMFVYSTLSTYFIPFTRSGPFWPKKTNKMSAIFYIEWVWYFAVCVCARVSVHVMKAMSICTIYFSTPFGFISNSVSIRIIQVWCNWNMWPSNSIFGVFHVWYQRAANRQTMMATTTTS